MRCQARAGFTLIELLVVIAIIGILMALLLPAVQKVREASNKARCANNLKQLGIALHAFHSMHSQLPHGVAYRTRADFGDLQPQGSWLVQLLPFMEQQALYSGTFAPHIQGDGPGGYSTDDIPREPPIPSPHYLHCPSDDWDHREQGSTNYGGSMGPQCVRGPCGYDPYESWCNRPEYGIPQSSASGDGLGTGPVTSDARGCFTRGGALIRFGDLKDGSTQTIMVGEVRPGECQDLGEVGFGGWIGVPGPANGSTLPPINYRTDVMRPCDSPELQPQLQPVTDSELREHSWRNWGVSYGFKSRHPGGALFLFADGSIHFLPETIDHLTYQLLGCRNDGRHVEEIP